MHPGAQAADAELVRFRRRLGGFELIGCSDGTFLLDGGAMFGVVPKTLWQKRMPADEQNRVLLGLNTLIVRTGTAVVAIETGLGNKQTAKMREILGNQEQLPKSLEAAGVRAEDVTHVVNTHLHFDHCGWNTTLHADGKVRPTFPNARYFAAAGEVAHGRLQLERDAVSYNAPNYDPLIESGQLTLIDPEGLGYFSPSDPRLRAYDSPAKPVPIQFDVEITAGVWVERFPGHTADLLAVHIESKGEHACFVGDLFPTHNHLDVTWVMGYDLYPLECIRQRKRYLKRAVEEQWLTVFPHDHAVPAGFVEWDEKGKPRVKQTLEG